MLYEHIVFPPILVRDRSRQGGAQDMPRLHPEYGARKHSGYTSRLCTPASPGEASMRV